MTSFKRPILSMIMTLIMGSAIFSSSTALACKCKRVNTGVTYRTKKATDVIHVKVTSVDNAGKNRFQPISTIHVVEVLKGSLQPNTTLTVKKRTSCDMRLKVGQHMVLFLNSSQRKQVINANTTSIRVRQCRGHIQAKKHSKKIQSVVKRIQRLPTSKRVSD